MFAPLNSQSPTPGSDGSSRGKIAESDVQSYSAPPNPSVPVRVEAQAANTDQLSLHALPTRRGAEDEPALLADRTSRVSAPSTTLERGSSILKSAVGASYRFILRAVGEEWMAAPIAFAASLPATFITSWAVVAIAPGLEKLFGGVDTVGYTLSTSTAAVLLGYTSYLTMYWGGMLWKERRDLFASDGSFVRAKLGEKVEIMKLDFLLHLPNDVFTMATMGAAQGSLYVAGASDLFWSIFLSQAAIDLFYCVREPFYWRMAKEAAEWRRRTSAAKGSHAEADEVANNDVKDLGQTKRRAAN